MTVSVIGGGPAGITAAYRLAREGVPVRVYEALGEVGGLARSIRVWGQDVDLGPHRFFSSDPHVQALWLEVVGDRYDIVNRMTRIHYKERFFRYPLRPFDALLRLGPLEALRCAASFAATKVLPSTEEESFEGWVTKRFGRRLFEIFFRTYSEKLWGIPCSELDSDFAAQRIRRLSFSSALWNALRSGGGSRHRTLMDQFAYPRGGNGSVYRRMAERIGGWGGAVRVNSPVRRVLAEGGSVTGIELETGESVPCDRVVSSMPLPALVEHLDGVPPDVARRAGQLRFRSTVLVYLRVDRPDLFPDNWLYVHSPGLRMGRVTNFRNWTPRGPGDDPATVLALEYWCTRGDDLWAMEEEELVALGCREIRAAGLLRAGRVTDGTVVKVPDSYPVYSRGYRSLLAPVEGFLRTVKGLYPVGRGGAFKYNNQDHSILMGIMAAENVLGTGCHDLWTINTDYEYQESGPAAPARPGRQG